MPGPRGVYFNFFYMSKSKYTCVRRQLDLFWRDLAHFFVLKLGEFLFNVQYDTYGIFHAEKLEPLLGTYY